MNKIVISIGLGLIMLFGGQATQAHAVEHEAIVIEGNGNDECQIGGIPGHKDHGQSNEHKIDYMTKTEWLDYIAVNNLIARQISNNEDSNGWITWHIYNIEGKQIEVVHIKYKQELPPIEDGSNDDNIQVKPEEEFPPALDGSEEDNMEVHPLPLPGLGPDGNVTPEIEGPILDGSEEDDYLTDKLPVGDGSNEDNNTVEPPVGDGSDDDSFLVPQLPVGDGSDKDNNTVEPPICDGTEEDDYLTDKLPVGDGSNEDNMQVEPGVEDGTEEDNYLTPQLPVGDGSQEDNMQVEPEVNDGSESDDMEVTPEEEVKKPTTDNKEEILSGDRLPQTGGLDSNALMLLGLCSAIAGLGLNRKKK